MRSRINLGALAVTSLIGLGTATPSYAEFDLHRWVVAPAQCNHDGLQPNHAAGLGNWTGTTKYAFCDIEHGDGLNVDWVKVDKTGPMTCVMKDMYWDGSTYWLQTHFSVENYTTYERIVFSQSGGAYPKALECQVPNGTVFSRIEMNRWLDDLI